MKHRLQCSLIYINCLGMIFVRGRSFTIVYSVTSVQTVCFLWHPLPLSEACWHSSMPLGLPALIHRCKLHLPRKDLIDQQNMEDERCALPVKEHRNIMIRLLIKPFIVHVYPHFPLNRMQLKERMLSAATLHSRFLMFWTSSQNASRHTSPGLVRVTQDKVLKCGQGRHPSSIPTK